VVNVCGNVINAYGIVHCVCTRRPHAMTMYRCEPSTPSPWHLLQPCESGQRGPLQIRSTCMRARVEECYKITSTQFDPRKWTRSGRTLLAPIARDSSWQVGYNHTPQLPNNIPPSRSWRWCPKFQNLLSPFCPPHLHRQLPHQTGFCSPAGKINR
jgi:hypothetical protein